MERRTWGSWKVRLAAGLVAVLLGALVAVLLFGSSRNSYLLTVLATRPLRLLGQRA